VVPDRCVDTLGLHSGAAGEAIAAGALLARRLSEKVITYGAAALFAIFEVVLILESVGVIGEAGLTTTARRCRIDDNAAPSAHTPGGHQ